MTIEENMEHFRAISLESATSQSSESLSSYKQSLDEELEFHKESATALAKERELGLKRQVNAELKKQLSSAQMVIKKDVTKKQAEIKAKVFDAVREKISDFRKSPEYVEYLKNQIASIVETYGNYDITIYVDPDDAGLIDELKKGVDSRIEVFSKEFLGGTRTIVPEKNILVDNSFKTRLADEQEQFNITL